MVRQHSTGQLKTIEKRLFFFYVILYFSFLRNKVSIGNDVLYLVCLHILHINTKRRGEKDRLNNQKRRWKTPCKLHLSLNKKKKQEQISTSPQWILNRIKKGGSFIDEIYLVEFRFSGATPLLLSPPDSYFSWGLVGYIKKKKKKVNGRRFLIVFFCLVPLSAHNQLRLKEPPCSFVCVVLCPAIKTDIIRLDPLFTAPLFKSLPKQNTHSGGGCCCCCSKRGEKENNNYMETC